MLWSMLDMGLQAVGGYSHLQSDLQSQVRRKEPASVPVPKAES